MSTSSPIIPPTSCVVPLRGQPTALDVGDRVVPAAGLAHIGALGGARWLTREQVGETIEQDRSSERSDSFRLIR